LARRPEIAARIEELLGKQQNRIGITVDALLLELDEMFKLAKRVKQPSAGVGVVVAKAKLLGLMTDKLEIEGNLRKPARQASEKTVMSVEEWQAKFAPGGKGTLQ
jgi:hypothetical protein